MMDNETMSLDSEPRNVSQARLVALGRRNGWVVEDTPPPHEGAAAKVRFVSPDVDDRFGNGQDIVSVTTRWHGDTFAGATWRRRNGSTRLTSMWVAEAEAALIASAPNLRSGL